MAGSGKVAAWLDAFQSKFDGGNSWTLMILIFVISLVLCVYCVMNKTNILAEWTYEPIVEVPRSIRNRPVIQNLFGMLRGNYYDVKPPNSMDYLKEVNPTFGASNRTLFSGFAFFHFLQHFCIAFFCPKLIAVSFIFSISWELFETAFNVHCVLDILWNLLGCLLGLLCRWIFCPITT